MPQPVGEGTTEERRSLLEHLAIALQQQGKLADAIENFAAAEQAIHDLGQEPNSMFLADLTAALTQLGQRERAAEFFRRAHEDYLKADIRLRRRQLNPPMIDDLEALGRHAEALAMMREFEALSDESVSVESNERIARLEANIELARTEQKLASSERDRLLLESALAESRSAQARQRTLGLAMALGLLALGLITLLLVRQVRFKARANALLEQKNRKFEAGRCGGALGRRGVPLAGPGALGRGGHRALRGHAAGARGQSADARRAGCGAHRFDGLVPPSALACAAHRLAPQPAHRRRGALPGQDRWPEPVGRLWRRRASAKVAGRGQRNGGTGIPRASAAADVTAAGRLSRVPLTLCRRGPGKGFRAEAPGLCTVRPEGVAEGVWSRVPSA